MEKSLWLAGFNYSAEGGLRELVTAPGMSTAHGNSPGRGCPSALSYIHTPGTTAFQI